MGEIGNGEVSWAVCYCRLFRKCNSKNLGLIDNPLKTITSISLHKDAVRTSQRTQCASVRKNY
jgi:hypothetical protein